MSQGSADGQAEAKSSVAVSALIFAAGTLLSRILGLVRDTVIAGYVGTDARDAFLNAFRLPNLFRRVFGEGSLSGSFVPVYMGLLESDAEKAKRVRAGVFSILFSGALLISTLAIVFMEELMLLLLNGHKYMAVPGKFELTVQLGRIMFGFLVAITLYGYFMAILTSMRRFALSALAPCVFNLVVIAVAWGTRRSETQVLALAWAVLIGGAAQMAMLIPGLARAGALPRFTWSWNMAEIGRVFRALGPSVFGLSVLQLTVLVNMRFAAELGSGSHSYLYFADRILELPLSLFVVSIGAALLPTLAKFWAAGDRGAMAETINHYLRVIVFVALPAAVGMFVLALPICETLFLGREFKYEDALATAGVIQIYSLVLIIAAGVRIFAQGFYAIGNTWYPAVAGAVGLVAHVIFAYVLTREFRLNGLAAASVASGFVNLTMLALAYNSWIGALELRRFGRSLAKFLASAAVMVAGLQAYGPLSRLFGAHVRGGRAMALLLVIAFGAGLYFACAHLLRVEEFRETAATLKSKFGRRFSARK